MNNLILHKDQSYKIQLDSTNPYFYLSQIGKDSQVKDRSSILLSFKTKNKEEKSTRIYLDDNFLEINNQISSFLDYQFIDCVYIKLNSEDLTEIEVCYTTANNFISIESPIISFDKHISLPGNERILFSGKFGSGKSTFLEEYFKSKSTHNTFHVYPVNYSIATTEDIFRYIKADILLQFIEQNIITPTDSSLLLNLTEQYLFEPKEFVKGILRLALNLGKNVFPALKLIKPLVEYVKKVNSKLTDSEEVNNYLKDLIEKEGGLFEDNIVTQIIRGYLLGYKESTDKKNVLIIEDLDRMDPEHIFRILNVISAHIDSYKYGKNTIEPNKFGFDQIIIVCDLNNIKQIFMHRYGFKADFTGYIDKFHSIEPFDFSIQNSLVHMCDRIHNQFVIQNMTNENTLLYGEILQKVLFDLIISNEITIRELKKFSIVNFHDEFLWNYQKKVKFKDLERHSVYTDLGMYLLKIPNIESKLKNARIHPNHASLDFDICVPLGFVPFSTKSLTFDNGTNGFSYQMNRFLCEYTLDSNGLYYNVIIHKPSSTIERNFNNTDFYEILEKNIEHVKKLNL